MTKQKSQARQQRGGTIVGFVIGVLVGLGAALAVAIYVTKVPVPFVDRNVSRDPAKDAQEAERNKGWNPNATLSGKSATGTVAQPAAGSGQEGAIVVPPADGQALPAPQAGTTSGNKPAGDPLGDLARAKLEQDRNAATTAAPAAPVAAAVGGADPFTYFVQAGAFKSREDAEAQRAKLGMLGVEAQITEREQSGRTVYRVRVGPFAQKSLADVTREQLEANGMEAALVRIQR
jgi:cell division protein FtsN